MTFLDTNVFIRYLTADDPAKAARCERLFDKVAKGREQVATHVVVIAEVIWVLTSRYGLPKTRVVDALTPLISLDGLQLDDKDHVLSALEIFRAKPIDFVDAVNIVVMQAIRVPDIYSYDTDFDRIPGLHRVEP